MHFLLLQALKLIDDTTEISLYVGVDRNYIHHIQYKNIDLLLS